MKFAVYSLLILISTPSFAKYNPRGRYGFHKINLNVQYRYVKEMPGNGFSDDFKYSWQRNMKALALGARVLFTQKIVQIFRQEEKKNWKLTNQKVAWNVFLQVKARSFKYGNIFDMQLRWIFESFGWTLVRINSLDFMAGRQNRAKPGQTLLEGTYPRICKYLQKKNIRWFITGFIAGSI